MVLQLVWGSGVRRKKHTQVLQPIATMIHGVAWRVASHEGCSFGSDDIAMAEHLVAKFHAGPQGPIAALERINREYVGKRTQLLTKLNRSEYF